MIHGRKLTLSLALLLLTTFITSGCVSVSGAGLDGTYSLDCFSHSRLTGEVEEYDQEIARLEGQLAPLETDVQEVDSWLSYTVSYRGEPGEGACVRPDPEVLEARGAITCAPDEEGIAALALCNLDALPWGEKAESAMIGECLSRSYLSNVPPHQQEEVGRFCQDFLQVAEAEDLEALLGRLATDLGIDLALHVAEHEMRQGNVGPGLIALLFAGQMAINEKEACYSRVQRICSRNYRERSFAKNPEGLTRKCREAVAQRRSLRREIADLEREIAAVEREAAPVRQDLARVESRMASTGVDCGG